MEKEHSETLSGLDYAYPAGTLEIELGKQISALRDLGYIEPHHSGLVALALATAHDIDRSAGRGAPSGRANLLRVMNEILQTLPQPETASKDKLDDVIAALMHDDDAEGVPFALRPGP